MPCPSSLKVKTTGLIFSAPRPLKSVSLSGHVHHFLASLTLSHIFDTPSSDELCTLPDQSTFKLVWPDFCAQILSFDFLDNDRVIKALPTDSKWQEDEHYRRLAPEGAPNVYTAVLSGAKNVELRLHFLLPLRAHAGFWQLQIPLHLCDYQRIEKRNQEEEEEGDITLTQKSFDFDASIQVHAPDGTLAVLSESHSIRFERNETYKSDTDGLSGIIHMEASTPCHAERDLVIRFSTSKDTLNFPQVVVETPSASTDGVYWTKTAMVIARPIWTPSPHHSDITIVVDSNNLDSELSKIGDDIKELMERQRNSSSEREAASHTSGPSRTPQGFESVSNRHSDQQVACYNFTIITKYGPQWAFPKPMPLSSELILKLSSFIEAWPSLIAKQGRRSDRNFPLALALSTINSRPSDRVKHILLIAHLPKRSMDTPESCIEASEALRIWTIGIGHFHDAFALQYLSTATDARYEPSYDPPSFKLALTTQLNRANSSSLKSVRLSLLANPSSPPPDLLLRHLSLTPHHMPSSALNAPGDLVHFFIGFKPSFFDYGFHTQLNALDFEICADSLRTIGSAEVMSAVNFEKTTARFSLPVNPPDTIRPSLIKSTSLSSFTSGRLVQMAAGMEKLLDFEESQSTAEPYFHLCEALSLVNLNSHLYATSSSRNGPSVTLFNVAENDFHSIILQSNSTSPSQSSEVGSATKKPHRIVRDAESLLQAKKLVDKTSKPHGLHVLSTSQSDTHSPSPSKSTPKKHGKTGSRQRTRPLLTIQSCWSSSAVLVQSVPSKPMSQYDTEFKQMNSTLNKITEENMERLGSKLVSESFSGDPYALSSLARLIYDKAVRQQMYAPLYAGLVLFLTKKLGENGETVRRAILDRCKHEFELVLDPPVVTSSTLSIETYAPHGGQGVTATSQTQNKVNSESTVVTNPSPNQSSNHPAPSISPTPDHQISNTSSLSSNGITAPVSALGVPPSSTPVSSTSIPISIPAEKGGRPRFFNSKLSSSPSTFSPLVGSPSAGPLFGSLGSLGRLKSTTEDAEEKENKAKEQRVGLIVFLTKLYKHGLISIDITQNCIGELFGAALKAEPTKCNELLVLAIKYIQLVGKYIQQANAQVIEKTFQYIDTEVLAETPHLDTRTKTLFQNLIELKDKNWIPREAKEDQRRK